MYYKVVQDARNTLESLNEIIDEATLIWHGLIQFKEHIDLKLDVKTWKKLPRADKTWRKFKPHFTKAIKNNKSDTGTLKAIRIANAVREQVDQNKENQRILAQATVEANDMIDWLENQNQENPHLKGGTPWLMLGYRKPNICAFATALINCE